MTIDPERKDWVPTWHMILTRRGRQLRAWRRLTRALARVQALNRLADAMTRAKIATDAWIVSFPFTRKDHRNDR